MKSQNDLTKLKSEHEKIDRTGNLSKNIEKELLEIMRDNEEIRLDKLSEMIGADKKAVMEKCKVLEGLNIVRIKYPLLGEPIIKRGSELSRNE